MVMKTFGACVLLFGLAMLIFAGMAYLELHAAATSETTPSADSMPMTKIVGPELFAPGNAGARPAEMARTTFNRIYTLAGGGVVLAFLGVVILAVPHTRGKKAMRHAESSG